MIKHLRKQIYLYSLLLAGLLPQCTQINTRSANTAIQDSVYYTMEDFNTLDKIDAHFHLRNDADTIFVEQAEKDKFRVLNLNVYTDKGKPLEEQQESSIRMMKKYPDIVSWGTAFSLKNFNQPGWQDEAIDYVRNSVSNEAIAVKVWKNIGFFLKDENGNLVMIDHPRFDPILDYLAKNQIPLVGHLGEHKNSWQPLEKMTVKGNRDYARDHPDEHMYLHPDRPSYEDYIAARDRMLDKHPDLVFIGAHLGSLEWSVDELAKRLDKYPNMAVDMAERISHLEYQTLTEWQKVHDFFIKYQDRLIYGTDLRRGAMDIVNAGITEPVDIKKHIHGVWLRHWRFFVTDEKMEVPKVNGEFSGLKLPREVIDKIYFSNAKRWYPGI